jgi:hypothetical protein
MSEQICLRCDWSGEAGGDTCPECGTVLYRMASPPHEDRAAVRKAPYAPPPIEDVFVPVVERSASAPRGPRRRSWIVGIAVAAVSATAIATIHPRAPSGPPAAHAPLQGLRGSLVYAARDPAGWVLWSWDLATGTASEGPHVQHPIELVSAAQASPGWIGVTSVEGRWRTASVVHSLSPDGNVNTIARANLITWSAGGADLTSLRYGPPTTGCRRHVDIRSWVVSFGTSETEFDGGMCGLPLTIARDGSFAYVVSVHGTSTSIRIVSTGYTQRFMDDHQLLGLSTRGDFLVTPVPRPGEVADTPPPGLQLFHRPPLNDPVSFGSKREPLQPLKFLSWSWDASEAYLLATYAGVRGIYRVTIAPGVGLRKPDLVERTDATTAEATVTVDGDVFMLLDGQLSLEHGEDVAPVALPAGAPPLVGPMLWVAPGGTTSGLG